MNWEEAAITAVILGFGPPKMADRAWFAIQAYRARQRERRLATVQARIDEIRKRLEWERIELEVMTRRGRLRLSLGNCRCGHDLDEHIFGTGRCTSVRFDSERSDLVWISCVCAGYEAGRR